MALFSVSPSLRSWVEIETPALRHNLGVVRSKIGPAPQILAVVKANAYGHGVGPVVRTLAGDATLFGVANLCEAREVAAVGSGRDVMLLSPCLPAERGEAVEAGFIVTVSSAAEAREFGQRGAVRVNFKIDTGMGRAGAWRDEALAELRQISTVRGLTVHSVSTHLPSSDEDADFTAWQLGEFERLTADLHAICPDALVHSLNSAGILRFPAHAAGCVRAGLVLYGVSPVPEFQHELRSTLEWKTRVTLVKSLPAGAGVSYGRTFIAERPVRTALLAIGYADGFPRQVSGRGVAVLLNGQRCPLLGRVTMDQIVVDISAAGDVSPGDEAVVIGRQGSGEITVNELAAAADTIAWDIFTGIKSRVGRVYPVMEPS